MENETKIISKVSKNNKNLSLNVPKFCSTFIKIKAGDYISWKCISDGNSYKIEIEKIKNVKN